MMRVIVSDEKDLIREIEQRVKEKGSQKAVALEMGISPPYLNDIMQERRLISEEVALKLGYIRVLHFVKVGSDYARGLVTAKEGQQLQGEQG
jgi:hypothetical protein